MRTLATLVLSVVLLVGCGGPSDEECRKAFETVMGAAFPTAETREKMEWFNENCTIEEDAPVAR